MTQDERKQSEFLDNLFRNYDLRIRPNFNGPPVEVITDMFVSSMDSVQETTMSYTMDIFMRQQWNDPRLSFTEYNHSVSVHTQLLNRMWFPDLFFPNEKRAYQHDVTTDNKLLRLFPNGDILYSVRLLLTLTCMMSLQKFPMDRQQCAVQCESYGFTTKDLLFKWRDVEPIQRDSNLQLPQFDIVGTRTLLCTKQYNTGNYTCVEGRFIMTRQMGYYMIQTYIPSMLIVILSWVSFWISAESSPARVALGITTVLTMTTQSSGANETLPKVSYVKAIDIWMAVCLLFVFAALVEFAAANYKSRKKIGKADRQKRQKENKVRQTTSLSNENSENSTLLEMKPIQTYIKTDFKSMPSTVTSGAQLSDTEVKVVLHKPPETDWAQYIDYVSRVAFPVAFLLFNIVYWTMYMTWYFNPDDD
uniref:Glycine receptor subunit alpha-3-like n=1 Tax=Saccoglossus kowalevskii TaxID=10224 RepID=A0ABM0LVP6_SACKO|nr:PREDICTED: glycine receptor subunit alpha-3-like [Saccoglossus kowalevskii]